MGSTPPSESYSWKAIHPTISQFYTRDLLTANTLIKSQFPPTNPPPAVGFDIEWKPNFRKGERENSVALVQLATSQTIFLCQISAMDAFPPALAALLADPRVVKAGVGIQGDVKKLFYDWNVSPMRNCVDLSLMAKSVDNDRWKGRYKDPIGLAKLIEHYEAKVLPKGKVTVSNWEANLTDSQIEYASNDAHSGFLLYSRLSEILYKWSSPLRPLPKRSYFSFDLHRGGLYQVSEPSERPVDAACPVHGSTTTLADPSCVCSHWDLSYPEINYATLVHWGPINPDYDPGPPPPPPDPSKQTEKKKPVLVARGLPGAPMRSFSTRARGGPRARGRSHGVVPAGSSNPPISPNTFGSHGVRGSHYHSRPGRHGGYGGPEWGRGRGGGHPQDRGSAAFGQSGMS